MRGEIARTLPVTLYERDPRSSGHSFDDAQSNWDVALADIRIRPQGLESSAEMRPYVRYTETSQLSVFLGPGASDDRRRATTAG
jgi:hypothetical protein